jgi:hypothetical protein
VAGRSKAWVCSRSLDEVKGSNPAGGMNVCLFCVLSVEVSASGRSLVQRNLIEWGVSECDREASIVRRPRPTGGCWATEQNAVMDVIIIRVFDICISLLSSFFSVT